MRVFLVFIITVCCIELIWADTPRLSNPIESNAESETYGAPIKEVPDRIGLSDLLNTPQDYLQKKVSLQARVSKVCQKKGCFFIAQQGKDTLRVSFKDYGFFVPTNIGGRQVLLVGELVARNVSEAQASHWSKDLGKAGSVPSGAVYEIIASSVRVPLE